MSKMTQPKIPWADSNAKRILVECLEKGEIPLDNEEMAGVARCVSATNGVR
jgi:hypothetical protein